MMKLTYPTPEPHKGGRVIHDMDGVARRRCRICGRRVFGRNGGICRRCLADRLDGNGTRKEVR